MMKKNYFILYGTILPVTDILDYTEKRLDVKFDLHESSYLGEYYKYSGLYADSITIERNQIELKGEFKEETAKDFPVLVYISIAAGKNKDKLSKFKYIKKCFFKVSGVQLLRESIIEE